MNDLCDDCGYNTTPQTGMPWDDAWEYFMVWDDIWPDECDFLCISCLEARLGRELVLGDFNDAPLNSIPTIVTDNYVLDLEALLNEGSHAFQHRTLRLHERLFGPLEKKV